MKKHFDGTEQSDRLAKVVPRKIINFLMTILNFNSELPLRSLIFEIIATSFTKKKKHSVFQANEFGTLKAVNIGFI